MKRIHINILITLIAVILIALMHSGKLDEVGEKYTKEGLTRALITYGVARGMNGAISVLQGTEVAVEPVGVGFTFAPGQILDPVNDLIERFSWIVMASGTSLGIQRMLIQMTGGFWFSVLVSAMLMTSLVYLWRGSRGNKTAGGIIFRAAMALLLVRLTIPVIAVINEGIYMAFLQPQYESSQTALQQTADDIRQFNETNQPAPVNNDESFMDSLKDIYQSAADSVDIKAQLEELSQAAAKVSENVIDMIVVFLLQTIIFPILFLWLAIKLVKSIITGQLKLS